MTDGMHTILTSLLAQGGFLDSQISESQYYPEPTTPMADAKDIGKVPEMTGDTSGYHAENKDHANGEGLHSPGMQVQKKGAMAMTNTMDAPATLLEMLSELMTVHQGLAHLYEQLGTQLTSIPLVSSIHVPITSDSKGKCAGVHYCPPMPSPPLLDSDLPVFEKRPNGSVDYLSSELSSQVVLAILYPPCLKQVEDKPLHESHSGWQNTVPQITQGGSTEAFNSVSLCLGSCHGCLIPVDTEHVYLSSRPSESVQVQRGIRDQCRIVSHSKLYDRKPLSGRSPRDVIFVE